MTRTNVTSLTPPAVVLVHGALTGPAIWTDVAVRLQRSGIEVLAPVLPMRSLNDDATYLASVLERLGRPVLVVGHSYAGAVISHPAITATGAVQGLVFVAAFQPDEGEAAGELNERFPGSLLTPENLDVAENPLGGTDITLKREHFAEVYAGDLSSDAAAAMATSQHPINAAALSEPLAGAPSWRSIPSWAMVATEDRSLPPETLRFMAVRAGSKVVEVESSHAVPASRPQEVADLVLEAIVA